MRRRLGRRCLLAAAAAGLALAGCGGEFNRANFETVYEGLGAAGVRRRIGDPDRVEGRTWIYEEHQPYRRGVVEFEDGEVVDTRWTYTPPEAGE